MRKRPGAAVVVLVLAAAAFGGCDDPPSAIGVTERDGQWVILFDPCSESRLVRSVELETEKGTTVWRIQSEEGSLLREFVVGGEPPGFSTEVPLASALAGLRFRAAINGVGPEYFKAGDITESSVFVVGEGSMTAEGFLSRRICR